MGFELAQKVLRNRLPLSASEKLLLAMIADRIDHKGYCYPSVSRLSHESGLSSRHIIRSLKVLDGINVLTITRAAGTNSKYELIEGVLDEMIEECTDSVSVVVVTDSQGGTDTESGGDCHSVSLINKTINKPITNFNKAEALPTAKAKLKVDGVELVEGEKILMGVDLGNGNSHTAVQVMKNGQKMQIENEPIQSGVANKWKNLIHSFGPIDNYQSSEFLYHLCIALDTLTEGQTYNIVTDQVPVSLIKKVEHFLQGKGYLTDYLNFKDQYIKIYMPKPPTVAELIPPMHSMTQSVKKLGQAFQVPAELMGAELIEPNIHFDLEAGEFAKFNVEGEAVDVDQIKSMVANGKTNLKPAKATPIRTWRDAVLEWRNENDIQGALMKSTQKDAGMLNKAKKKYGAGFEFAMVHAVLQWDKFVTYANLNTGGKSKPVQPSISYFVLCIENVKLFLNKKSDTKVKLKQPIKLKVTKKVLKEGKSKTQKLLAAVKAQEEQDES